MNPLIFDVGLIVVLVALNAFLAGSEVALVTLRESQIDRVARRGRSGAAFARLARDPNRFLATIQIGITLAGFLASATAAVSLAEPLVPALPFLGDLAEPAAILLVTGVLTFLTLVFGELAPKRIALQRAESWGRLAARPLTALARLSQPVVWVLGKATDAIVRLSGGDPSAKRSEMDDEELRHLVSSRPGFHRMQRKLLSGALDIADRTLRQVLIPRTQVLFLPPDLGAEEAVQRLAEAGHSRAPVHGEDVDDILGVVHLRDLVGHRGPIGRYLHPAVALPETASALAALSTLQRERQQLALVIDEHGGTEGIVTIEDLLEEVVGELHDEHDPDLQSVERLADGGFVVGGRFPLHDAVDLGVSLPEGPYTTLGGLVMDQLGRIPRSGDVVELDDCRLEVLETARHSVKRLRLSPKE
jgi:putative hemolysin